MRLLWIAVLAMPAMAVQAGIAAFTGDAGASAVGLLSLLCALTGVWMLSHGMMIWAARLTIVIPGFLYSAGLVGLTMLGMSDAAWLLRAILIPYILLTSIFASTLVDMVLAGLTSLVSMLVVGIAAAPSMLTPMSIAMYGLDGVSLLIAVGLWRSRIRIMSLAAREHKLYADLLQAKLAQDASTMARMAYYAGLIEELRSPVHRLESQVLAAAEADPDLAAELEETHKLLAEAMSSFKPLDEQNDYRDGAELIELHDVVGTHFGNTATFGDGVPERCYCNRNALVALLRYLRLHATEQAQLRIDSPQPGQGNFRIVCIGMGATEGCDPAQLAALSRRLGGAYRRPLQLNPSTAARSGFSPLNGRVEFPVALESFSL